MLKVLVYDSGWGGELVADYLANELKVIEVTRLIDWKNLPYSTKTPYEIKHLLCERLQNYIGKIDLIVLGGFVVSEYIEYLRRQFPNQVFVGLDIDLKQITGSRCQPDNIAVFIGSQSPESFFVQKLRHQLPEAQLSIICSEGWEKLIDDGELDKLYIQRQLAPHFILQESPESRKKRRQRAPIIESLRISQEDAASRSTIKIQTYNNTTNSRLAPDLVILLNTHFWELRPTLEQLFGWKVRFVDFRQKLLHDVCAALKLLGVDGARRKTHNHHSADSER